MENKFVIIVNEKRESYIILSNVNYHREIEAPSDMGRPIGRAGGGKWFINNNGELKLYDLSGDFGKYDKEMAQEAFNNKRIYYSDKPAYHEFKISKLKME